MYIGGFLVRVRSSSTSPVWRSPSRFGPGGFFSSAITPSSYGTLRPRVAPIATTISGRSIRGKPASEPNCSLTVAPALDIPFAMRFFGWIPEARTTRSVATKFVAIGALPLWPVSSELVDTATMFVERGKPSQFSRWRIERTTYQSTPLPLDRRSILAAYLRSWGVLLAIVGIVRLSSATWEPIAYAGVGAFIVGRMLRLLSFLRVGTYLTMLGWGAILSVIAAMFLPWAVGFAFAACALPAWRSLHWERGAIEVPKMTVVEAKSATVGSPRALTAPLAPLASVAPAHVERVDQPRLLT